MKFNAFLHPNEHPERICLHLVRQFEAEMAKIGHIFTKQTFTKKTKINNGFSKSCSSNSIFLRENCFWKDLVDKRPQKLTLNSENALFLMARL